MISLPAQEHDAEDKQDEEEEREKKEEAKEEVGLRCSSWSLNFSTLDRSRVISPLETWNVELGPKSPRIVTLKVEKDDAKPYEDYHHQDPPSPALARQRRTSKSSSGRPSVVLKCFNSFISFLLFFFFFFFVLVDDHLDCFFFFFFLFFSFLFLFFCYYICSVFHVSNLLINFSSEGHKMATTARAPQRATSSSSQAAVPQSTSFHPHLGSRQASPTSAQVEASRTTALKNSAVNSSGTTLKSNKIPTSSQDPGGLSALKRDRFLSVANGITLDDFGCSNDELRIFTEEGEDEERELALNEELQAALLEDKTCLIRETELGIKQERLLRIDPGHPDPSSPSSPYPNGYPLLSPFSSSPFSNTNGHSQTPGSQSMVGTVLYLY
eukprot:TCALIF_07702-PA protein Name:"Protein of unknown function" AED:0.32 eAED:0.32 QI:0/0.33/0/0.5/1/1/4/0/381